jgi:hypothetical protein
MNRIQRTLIGNNDSYVVHPVGQPWWRESGPLPLVTVAVGEASAVLRLTDADATEPLTPDQWSRAQAVAERVAVPIGDDDDRPLVFMHRTLVVEVPSLAVAEHLARFLLTLATPTGPLP